MGGPIFLYIFEGRKTETAMVYKKPSTNTTLTHSHTHTHTHTKLCQLAGGRSEGKLSNSWGSKRKSWTHLPSTFDLINTRNKKIKP